MESFSLVDSRKWGDGGKKGNTASFFSSQQVLPSERVAVLILTEENRRGFPLQKRFSNVSGPFITARIPNRTHHFSIMKLTLGNMNSYLTPKVKVPQSCPILCNPMDCTVLGILQAGVLEWVAFFFSRESSHPRDRTQVSHCRQILYQRSHKGSPRILEWVACSFSRGSSRPRNRTGFSCIAGGFFTN